MKTNGLFAALILLSFAAASPAVAQHAEHEEKEGMACCSKHEGGDMDMGGMHEMKMTHVLITHEVADADAWMAAWTGEDSRHKLFKENGAKHVHTFRSDDNPNLTGLVIAVSDLEKLMAMIESDEGQAAAAADGVKMDTMIMLVEAK